MKNKNIGSSFDSWLCDEGKFEDVTSAASQRLLTRNPEATLKGKEVTRASGEK